MLQKLIKSVPHKSIAILNELAVPQKNMLRAIIDGCFEMNHSILKRFILSKLLKYITGTIRFRQIHTGLVAIINLTDQESTP